MADSEGRLVVVGGYSPEMHGNEPGLTTWRVADGRAERLDVGECSSPSYLLVLPPGDRVIACHEEDVGALSTWRLSDDGVLQRVSQVDSGGNGTCHLALVDERFVVAVHYWGSCVTTVALEDWQLGEVVGSLGFQGHGPVADRQDASHPHMAFVEPSRADGSAVVWVSDLGADRLRRLVVAADGGLTETAGGIGLPPGSGPRHFAFTGDPGTVGTLVVVSCELSGKVWVARHTAAGWEQVGLENASAAGVSGNLPSALRCAPDPGVPGAFLVTVGNRGADTVTRLRLHPDGTLEHLWEVSSGGGTPRDVWVERAGHPDEQVWCANLGAAQGHNPVSGVTLLRPGSGELLARTDSPCPTCVVPVGSP